MRLRLKRDAGGAGTFARAAWGRRWVKALAVLAGLILLAIAAFWAIFMRDLPSVDKLRAYEPPLPTNVRGEDGTPIHSYARERRVELSYEEFPPLLVRAYLAAEDKTFFKHHGVDPVGIVSAVLSNATRSGRPRGASTITQQVAKNLLVGNQRSYSRKVREAILAWKIEDVLTKPQILELYLNQIFLGRNAYGVEAASRAYFDKEPKELDLAQMAYLAILPKGPANYDPDRDTEAALARRHYVLGEMLKNGWITQAQFAEADAEPLGTVRYRMPVWPRVGGYFVEEVRRQLIAKYGEDEQAGPYSVYSGGLWVRTSLDPKVQSYAQQALRDGLVRYAGNRWTGPLRHLDITDDNWFGPLLNSNVGVDYKDWRAAIVISRDDSSAQLGFANGKTGEMPRYAAQLPQLGTGSPAFGALKPGDVIAVAPQGDTFALRSVPRISGGFVVEEPQTGRILAMQGGFDNRISDFNRATQALRQPGSTIKPIVYSAALENGMTPATILVDGPFCIFQTASLGTKCFRNFGGSQGSGPHTMRWGIEQSRNLMTVRAASQTGMPKVVKLIKDMGIGDFQPYLAYSLGAGVTTVSRMVNAFSVLVNQGRWHAPSLIDYVQDRHGRVVWPENWRPCTGCNMADWDGKPMPRPFHRARQVVDPLTAYQMVHITEGVIQRGTAVGLRDLNRPMMGKTGTNTGPTDVWFIGGTPQMIGGLYMGYDHPSGLGGYAQGGTLAVPIFHQFALKAFDGMEKLPFRAPAGVRMVRIDRASGRPVFGGWPTDDPKAAVIWEAFKPASAAIHARHRGQEVADKPKPTGPQQQDRANDSDFLQRQGGIY